MNEALPSTMTLFTINKSPFSKCSLTVLPSVEAADGGKGVSVAVRYGEGVLVRDGTESHSGFWQNRLSYNPINQFYNRFLILGYPAI